MYSENDPGFYLKVPNPNTGSASTRMVIFNSENKITPVPPSRFLRVQVHVLLETDLPGQNICVESADYDVSKDHSMIMLIIQDMFETF